MSQQRMVVQLVDRLTMLADFTNHVQLAEIGWLVSNNIFY